MSPTLSDLRVEIPAGNASGPSVSIACPTGTQTTTTGGVTTGTTGGLTFSNTALDGYPRPGNSNGHHRRPAHLRLSPGS